MNQSDTSEIVTMTRSQLEWFRYALVVVQLRNLDEQSAHLRLSSAVSHYTDEPVAVLALTPPEIVVGQCAVNEGRIRNHAERLVRSELQRMFEKMTGCKGVNDV